MNLHMKDDSNVNMGRFKIFFLENLKVQMANMVNFWIVSTSS